MKVLPFEKDLPINNKPGTFWEDRADRFHCGIDIYSSVGSEVFCIDSGKVVDTGVFTSNKMLNYWNKTYFVDVKLDNGLFCRYAEMEKINVKKDDFLKPGDIIGFVGQVLNKDKIDKNCPKYIQKLAHSDNISMLHFELYKDRPIDINDSCYLGGNWFCKDKPDCLLDPLDFLKNK